MIVCTLKLPLTIHDNDNDYADNDEDDIYTPPSIDYNTSVYGSLSYPGETEYESYLEDEFDDVEPEMEENVDSAPPKGIVLERTESFLNLSSYVG